jgi:hypothetical protein
MQPLLSRPSAGLSLQSLLADPAIVTAAADSFRHSVARLLLLRFSPLPTPSVASSLPRFSLSARSFSLASQVNFKWTQARLSVNSKSTAEKHHPQKHSKHASRDIAALFGFPKKQFFFFPLSNFLLDFARFSAFWHPQGPKS